MVNFNGFDKGVIGGKLPSDTTLNQMKKAELIKLLHLAEDNHRVLVETYKIAVDNSKCNICPLSIDTRKTIDETLKIINRKIALLEERLRIETCEGRWVDEEKCRFAIEQLEFLAEQLEGDAE